MRKQLAITTIIIGFLSFNTAAFADDTTLTKEKFVTQCTKNFEANPKTKEYETLGVTMPALCDCLSEPVLKNVKDGQATEAAITSAIKDNFVACAQKLQKNTAPQQPPAKKDMPLTKESFISECTKQFSATPEIKKFEAQGAKMEDLCTCLADPVMSNVAKGQKTEDAATNAIKDSFVGCLKKFVKATDATSDASSASSEDESESADSSESEDAD